jgi:hypothetical protein
MHSNCISSDFRTRVLSQSGTDGTSRTEDALEAKKYGTAGESNAAGTSKMKKYRLSLTNHDEYR